MGDLIFIRNIIKKKSATKHSSTDNTDGIMCESREHTGRYFRQSQSSKVNKYKSFYVLYSSESLNNKNSKGPWKSSNSFQISPFQGSFMPKNIVPNTESTKYNGFYIEAGAGDGEIISNSLYFEINYKVIYKNNILKYVP